MISVAACGGGASKRDRNVDFTKVTNSNCSPNEVSQVNEALVDAEKLTADAVAYFAADVHGPRYTLWFGPYEPTRWATVKSTFEKIYRTLNTEAIKTNCRPSDCSVGTFSFVYPSKLPFEENVCSAFFAAPRFGTDTRAGTLIHDLSHLVGIGPTQDWVFGASAAISISKANPGQAINNADNYEYFAENDPVISATTSTSSTSATTALAPTTTSTSTSTTPPRPITTSTTAATTTEAPTSSAATQMTAAARTTIAVPTSMVSTTTKAETATPQTSTSFATSTTTATSPSVSVKTLLIRCVKGKTVKKVGGTRPRCPAGYKRK